MAVLNADTDPRALIRECDMTIFQVIVVTLCILICALDGFDVRAIAEFG